MLCLFIMLSLKKLRLRFSVSFPSSCPRGGRGDEEGAGSREERRRRERREGESEKRSLTDTEMLIVHCPSTLDSPIRSYNRTFYLKVLVSIFITLSLF